MKTKIRAEIFKGKDKKKNQFYYRIKSRNGQILCVSEGYTMEKDAVRAAANLIQDIQSGAVELISESAKHYKQFTAL